MPGKYFLVLDAGTTAVKALVFDDALTVKSRAVVNPGKTFPRGGHVEQDPEEIITACVTVLKQAVLEAGITAQDIASLGITNQRETIVAWDATSGQAIHPAIVWEDTRTASVCRWLRLRGKSKTVRQKTGLSLDPYFSASKISWILENVPRAKELAAAKNLRVGTIDTWILWRLTETHEYKTDHTNACRTLLFNINTLVWDPDLFKLFKVPEGLMASVEPSQGSYGSLNSAILGLPVPIRAVCGDQQASMYAAGISPATTKITYGTGAFVMHILGEKSAIVKPFFTTLVPGQGKTPVYALEQKVGECGQRVTLALGNSEALSEVLNAIAREVNVYIKKLPLKPLKIIADGGVMRNSDLPKIQSEVSGIPVEGQAIFDGTALGVAKLLAHN